jgi:hypothetical protein
LPMISGYEGTWQAIQIELVDVRKLVPPPHHRSAAGPARTRAQSKGRITPTGEYGYTTTRQSHHRKTPKYRVR